MNCYKTLKAYKVVIVLIFIWSGLLGWALEWNLATASKHIMEQANAEARASFTKDYAFRRWASSHGGVYVPVTETQKPLPLLSYIPDQNVTTTEGLQLTLLNPGAMFHQMINNYTDDYGIRGRITGLKYINPLNKPDNWEAKQLENFTHGEKNEAWEITEIDDKPYLRYLRAMKMEQSCLKCHGQLGYKLGDVRGASGVSVPLAHYYEHIDSTVKLMILSYGAIWLIGLLGLVISGKINFQRQLVLRQNHNELTDAVKQRTAELEVYKNELELLVTTRTQELEEEKYKLNKAQEIAHVGCYRWDIDDNKTKWSDELYRITGNEAQEFVPSYIRYLNCVHPDDKEKFQLLTKDALEGKSNYSGEYRIVRPDGELRHVLETGEIIPDYKQGRFYLVGVIQDITERKISDDESKRVQNELQQAQKMESLGNLTGGIAHDFNNLLGVITGYASLVENELQNQADEKVRGYIHYITKAGTRAATLVAQMLAFSRGEQVEDTHVKFSSLIQDEIKMLRSIFPSTIEIKDFINLELPKVLMSSTQFHQIVMNLAINARDAIDGVGVLTIRLGWARDMNTYSTVSHKLIRGDWIELSISDTGPGIDDDTAHQIFDPFFTTQEIGKGTGMGLSVIYRIVENHSGHIILESEKGKGSIFRILFPPIIDEDTNKGNLLQEAVDIPIGDGSEILVVDDEIMLSTQLSEMLETWGYKSTTMNNGIEALEYFKKNSFRFSLLITDQTMPGMTGTDLTAKIRQIRPSLPVIICSGYSEKINTTRAGEFNVSYFNKPVNADKLQLKIAELLLID